MSITFYDGPNLSGRSAALRESAWDRDGAHGLYLHPTAPANLSGLARTVAGEAYLHGFDCRQRTVGRGADQARTLIADLPRRQALATLSGGQQVRMILACALATSTRLAIDGLLEQLDRAGRQRVVDLLYDAALTAHVADNYRDDLLAAATEVRCFARPVEAVDHNAALAATARAIGTISASAPTLALSHLSFRYSGGPRIFDRASFVFEPGHPYILQAPNGSGKSTLARLLVGVLKPDGGDILVGGERHRPWRSADNLLFYAFQNPLDQIFGSTVGGYLARLDAHARRRRTFLEQDLGQTPATIVEGFRLEEFVSAEPFDLPPFVAKRLSIAAALLSRSSWLFFDEPSLGSDAEGRSGLAALFQSLCRSGFGVIIVSHGAEFDSLPGARRVTIDQGKVVPGGTDGGI